LGERGIGRHICPKVARGLVEKPADWPWSSVHWYRKGSSPIELVDARLFRQREFDRLKEGRCTREVD